MLRVKGLRKSFHRGLPPRRRTIQILKRDAGEVTRPERLGYCPQIPDGLGEADGSAVLGAVVCGTMMIAMVWMMVLIAITGHH